MEMRASAVGLGLVWQALAAACLAGEAPAAKGPASFTFTLKEGAALTSAGVFDASGRLVRQLWAMKPLGAGEQKGEWGGLDEFDQRAPAGQYEFRVVANHSTYRNVGALGNTKRVPTVQTAIAGMAVDAQGSIYCANTWEEAGQDFNRLDKDGDTTLHAKFRVRNGKPNGFPYAIALGGDYIYLSVITSEKVDEKRSLWGGHVVRRFRTDTGEPAPFERGDELGNIRFYRPGGETKFEQPLTALAVVGDLLLVADKPANRIAKFGKVTGEARGAFAAEAPVALAADDRGRLWVGHEGGTVTIFDLKGKALATPITDAGDIGSLAFGPKGQLVLADRKAGRVKLYDVRRDRATLARTVGQDTQPGDWAPDAFYQLSCAAMDPEGNLLVAHRPPTGGAILVKLAPDGRCLWRHAGLEFCTIGTYSQRNPDEFIDTQLNRLLLRDRAKGAWEFRGNLLDGDPALAAHNHGVPRILRLGDNDFFFQCYGDGVVAFRRTGDALRPAAIASGRNPRPDGKHNDRLPLAERLRWPTQWSWTDADGDGVIGEAEVDLVGAALCGCPLQKASPAGGGDTRAATQGRPYAMFGANVDAAGNILYCEQHARAIWELPLAKLDEKTGNPVYDWSKAKEIVPRDTSAAKFFPLMALRVEDGSIYAFGRSEAWPRPGDKSAEAAWMGGWALLRYTKDGKPMWAAKLPSVCVGMDAIPGGRGVMLGYYKEGHIYHYTADGLLIGRIEVGEAGDKNTGWMDNTSALAVARDPRDGLLDIFGEDSLNNRILWYRADDRDIRTLTGKFQLAPP